MNTELKPKQKRLLHLFITFVYFYTIVAAVVVVFVAGVGCLSQREGKHKVLRFFYGTYLKNSSKD